MNKNIKERNSHGFEKRPFVGVGIMVMRDGKVLLGKRKGSHGEGEFALPGGHLEFGETFEQTAISEVKEETGLKVDNPKFIAVTNDFRYIKSNNKHYITIGMLTELKSGEPEVLEPDKCERWDWYNLDNLPHPLFEPSEGILENYKRGISYSNKYLQK